MLCRSPPCVLSMPSATVTGATGFIASELIKQLLAKGYDVKATVRGDPSSTRLEYLRKLADALPGTLQLVQADLLQPGSFDSAVEGVDFVFHVASPFFINVTDPVADLITPAVEGTRNVINSVVKHKGSVKKVVVTSSVAAVHGRDKLPPKEGPYTEEDWNTESTVENGQAYWVSKTKAEQLAFELAKQHGIDLVTILPNFVLGPILSASSSAGGLSVGFIKGLLEGTPPGSPMAISDVTDVARAHILAAEDPTSTGRYIIANTSSFDPKDITQWLQAAFPKYEIPQAESQTSSYQVDISKAAKQWGFHPTSGRETYVDMAATAIKLGIAKPAIKASS